MSSTYIGKTGDKANLSGRYAFLRYIDGKTTPTPTANEKVIPLQRGETFPPVRSSNKAAYWQYIGA